MLVIRVTDPNPIEHVSQQFKDAVNAGTRQWFVELDVYFDGPEEDPTTLTEEDVMRFDLLEEIASPGTDPIGVISSNEFEFTLSNDNRRFTPTNDESEYYGKLNPNVLVKPYLGLKRDDEEIEGVSLGTFWVRDWRARSERMEVQVPCYDSLYKWGQLYVPGLRASWDTTFADFLSLVLGSIGLTTSDYVIDEGLEVPIKVGWAPEGKLKDVLQEICHGIAFVDMARDGRIQFRPVSILTEDDVVFSFTDEDQITSIHVPTEMRGTYTRVQLTQSSPTIRPSEDVLRISKEVPGNGSVELSRASYRLSPVALVERITVEDTNNTVSISDILTTSVDMSCTLSNSDEEDQEVTVIATGLPIEKAHTRHMKVDEDLEETIEKRELHIENNLMQDDQLVSDTLDLIVELVTDPHRFIEASVRGNPAVIPGNTVSLSDPSDKIQDETANIIRRRLSYDGGVEESYDLYRVVEVS